MDQDEDNAPGGEQGAAAGDPARGAFGLFVRRRAAVLLVGLLVLFLGLLLWYATHVLLILFAGLLFGLFLVGLTDLVGRWVPVPHGVALAVVVVLLVALAVGTGWLLGPRIASQSAELGDRLPKAAATISHFVKASPSYRWVAARLPPLADLVPAGGLTKWVTGYVSGVANFFVELVIVLFFGLFLAAQPGVYVRAAVLLVPPARRPRARGVLDRTGEALRWWLLGRIVSMTIIGVLDGVGLWLLGVPLPLTLGILAGLLTFLPNFGPVISTVPAVLVALTRPDHPWLPVWVVALKVAVQAVESYLVTPLVQQRAIHMPPAATLGAQFLLGTLAGLPGLALAVPLTAAAVVVTRMVYVEDVLGDRGTPPEPRT